MAVTLHPNGTQAALNFNSNAWNEYKPTKMRIKCNSSWESITVMSGWESTIYSGSNLSVPADTYHTFDLVWNSVQESGILGIVLTRDPNEPTPNNLGAIITAIEFGPEEKTEANLQ